MEYSIGIPVFAFESWVQGSGPLMYRDSHPERCSITWFEPCRYTLSSTIWNVTLSVGTIRSMTSVPDP